MKETSIEWSELLARLPDGVVCTDEARRIVWSNRAAERLLGRAEGELLGVPLIEVLELDDGLRTKGSVIPERAVGKRKDGSMVEVEISLADAAAWSGRKVTAAFLRDLSASDRSLSTDQLAGERESFLSMAAHQLRAPIQPILSSLRTIERALALGKDPPSDTMSRAMRQALRLGRLVDAILSDAAAIERGDLEVHVSTFDLGAFTRDLVEDFRQITQDKRVEYRGPREEVVIVSDQERVNQILLGLIDNALKYSLRTRIVKVEVEALDTRARVRVIDEGIGIPAAEQARVFGKFYRGSNVPNAAGGLGVGLYLARGLAARLHGTLSVASELGRGSAFSLVLPRQWPEPGKGARPGQGDVHTSPTS